MTQKEAWRAYYELALGLTETSRKKAMKIVQDVAGKGGATAEQVQELVNAGLANREAMTRMIRVELDRALSRIGLATMDEVEELTKRVQDLERQLHEARTAAGAGAASSGPVTSANGATTTTAKKAVAKKSVAKKPVSEKSGSEKSVAKKSVAKKTSAKVIPATSKAAATATTKTAASGTKKASGRRAGGTGA